MTNLYVTFSLTRTQAMKTKILQTTNSNLDVWPKINSQGKAFQFTKDEALETKKALSNAVFR